MSKGTYPSQRPENPEETDKIEQEKKSSKKDGSLASEQLKDPKSTSTEKSVAGSGLAQRKGATGKDSVTKKK